MREVVALRYVFPAIRAVGITRGVGGAAARRTKTHTNRRWSILHGATPGAVDMIRIQEARSKGPVSVVAFNSQDFAITAERRDGMSPHQAIRQACLLRFRPILMTTMAAMLSGLPLMKERCRVGTTQTAWFRDRGRAAVESGADALHDAGDLPGAGAALAGAEPPIRDTAVGGEDGGGGGGLGVPTFQIRRPDFWPCQ